MEKTRLGKRDMRVVVEILVCVLSLILMTVNILFIISVLVSLILFVRDIHKSCKLIDKKIILIFESITLMKK